MHMFLIFVILIAVLPDFLEDASSHGPHQVILGFDLEIKDKLFSCLTTPVLWYIRYISTTDATTFEKIRKYFRKFPDIGNSTTMNNRLMPISVDDKIEMVKNMVLKRFVDCEGFKNRESCISTCKDGSTLDFSDVLELDELDQVCAYMCKEIRMSLLRNANMDLNPRGKLMHDAIFDGIYTSYEVKVTTKFPAFFSITPPKINQEKPEVSEEGKKLQDEIKGCMTYPTFKYLANRYPSWFQDNQNPLVLNASQKIDQILLVAKTMSSKKCIEYSKLDTCVKKCAAIKWPVLDAYYRCYYLCVGIQESLEKMANRNLFPDAKLMVDGETITDDY